MSIINEFAKRVLSENGSFSINIEEQRYIDNYRFIQDRVGNARYIYGMYDFNNDSFYSESDTKIQLVAIVADGLIYITDGCFFKLYREENLPESVVTMGSFAKAMNVKNDSVNYAIFKEFYNSLPTIELDDYILKSCKKEARRYLFTHENIGELESVEFSDVSERLDELFKEKDYTDILCGFKKVEEIVRQRLEEKKDNWAKVKSITETTINYIKKYRDNDIAFDWEIKMANCLKSVDAKTVTVEFEMNCKTASGKININRFNSVLERNDSFSDYDFTTMKQGELLLKELGADRYDGTHLCCKNITKITYGKKELYVRETA